MSFLRREIDFFGLNGHVEDVVEDLGCQMHNLFLNVWFEVGDKEVKGGVVKTVLDAEVNQTEEDPGSDIDCEGHKLGNILRRSD